VEIEIPHESYNVYSIYQQNVHKFFNELRKSIFSYRQSMTNLQLECIRSCEIIINVAFAFNQNFANTSTVITPYTLKMTSSVQQTKNEAKAKVANEYTIQNKIPSELPPLQSSFIISAVEIRPSKSKNIRKFHAEKLCKNEYAHQHRKILRMEKVQDEQIKFFTNKLYQDLPITIKHEIVTKGECQNCGKLMEDSLLTHCSNVCLFEDYLKSKSVSHTLIEI